MNATPIDMNTSIFVMNTILDDPEYEGFGLVDLDTPSRLGRKDYNEDLEPGYHEGPRVQRWTQQRLADTWVPLKLQGKVRNNDFPCFEMRFPVFSRRACDILGDLLRANGEILPVITPEGEYYYYNITTISDAFDTAQSQLRWLAEPYVVMNVHRYEFFPEKVMGLSIFRIHENPPEAFVNEEFVARVEGAGLRGFDFTKVWPLPPGADWHAEERAKWRKRVREVEARAEKRRRARQKK